MPELPEVEVIKKDLSKIVKCKIINAWKGNKKFKAALPEPNLLIGENIKNIFRRNKYIIVETNNSWLIFHLGMTGRLILSKEIPTEKHIHFWLQFSKDHFLYFQDPRRFGKIIVEKKVNFSSYNDIPFLSKLGVEPLSEEFNFKNLGYVQNLVGKCFLKKLFYFHKKNKSSIFKAFKDF